MPWKGDNTINHAVDCVTIGDADREHLSKHWLLNTITQSNMAFACPFARPLVFLCCAPAALTHEPPAAGLAADKLQQARHPQVRQSVYLWLFTPLGCIDIILDFVPYIR